MANKVSDKLYIDFSSSNLTPAIFDALTYTNPEYYQKMNMGISVYGIPKTLQTFQWKPKEGTLEVLRGEYQKILMADPQIRFEENFKSFPIKLQYINNDFPLDEHQEKVVQTLKGKRQGVVHAVTSAGKSLIIIKSICEIGQRALIVVHRKILMQQFIEDIEKYVRNDKGERITIGIIGDGKKMVGDITIAIDKSLSKNLDDYTDEFGTLFMDECHLAPTTTMLTIVNSFRCERKYGFSGTLKRKDQKEFLIFATFGNIIGTISRDVLLSLGRVVPVDIKIISSRALFDYPGTCEALGITRAHQIMQNALMTDPGRNNLILDLVSKFKGMKTIVLSNLVAPCYSLAARLQSEYGIKCGIITGKDTKEALASYEAMKHGSLEVIFATVGCVSTGVSISDLDNLVLIAPIYTNELLLHQIRGRLMRTAEGKTHGTLYFIYDEEVFDDRKLAQFKNIMEK